MGRCPLACLAGPASLRRGCGPPGERSEQGFFPGKPAQSASNPPAVEEMTPVQCRVFLGGEIISGPFLSLVTEGRTPE